VKEHKFFQNKKSVAHNMLSQIKKAGTKKLTSSNKKQQKENKVKYKTYL